ncbi:hypothetical protein F5884DRAFT_681678 [Xylogone sp. PMI_703]|nr:hypothetical protein F5884DRAFT_681678 [Xylogone sp. PMI_703]
MGESQDLNPPFPPVINIPNSHAEYIYINDNSSTLSTLDHIEQVPTAWTSLPTIARDKNHETFLVRDHIEKFLKIDLDMERLNRIHGYLWMAGRPLNARPLQRQKMMGFDIVPTEKADLHLLKFSHKLLVKPLPQYMLDYEFWSKYLCTKELHGSACGFLLSYVWLICSPLDLKMAHQLHLIPSHIEWRWWVAFVTEFIPNVDTNTLHQVNKRYHFGELRLRRINTIYRLRYFYSHFVRGYLYGYNRYVVFFQRNFAWMLVLFSNLTIILSAMQVALAVPSLNVNNTFQESSYNFAVFSIFAVIAFLGLLVGIFGSIYLYNMVAAISHCRRETQKRRRLLSKEQEGV